ncbi:hypothetical protein Q0590_32720 [Rhodocytophaga aerolata]|uniref:Uncharacterized protein n=1 Tax=Rhodocytophaga aerolata TaxID=455078 RepID=A0ABT8RGH8_9BACT|nr:hypothetical protein [Rhodocytophaga aerolata]MDO1451084.1 hypothetical protein [Rhodocytophaga aerolata]
MRSAFLLENGTRLVFETTPTSISIYFCDEHWHPVRKFANMDLIGSEEEYHANIRFAHQAAPLVAEQSTQLGSRERASLQ